MVVDRFDPGRQPSGRTPAPGRLGLVQAFANSFWDLDRAGADEWEDAAAYGRWLAERGFGGERAGEADRARAIEVREARGRSPRPRVIWLTAKRAVGSVSATLRIWDESDPNNQHRD